MKQTDKKHTNVLASLSCQEAAHLIRVELRLYRYDDTLEEVARHDDQREAEIEHAWEAILTQVLGEARRRGWPHPFTVAVLAGPHGALQVGPCLGSGEHGPDNALQERTHQRRPVGEHWWDAGGRASAGVTLSPGVPWQGRRRVGP